MQNWTPEGWQLLKRVAIQAALKSGHDTTAHKVIKDSISLTAQVIQHPYSGQKTENMYGEDRYYSVFNAGKVAIWFIDSAGPVFVGAYSSLPNPIVV